MSCPQTFAGIPKDCSPSMGGIEVVLLANRDDVTAVTVTTGKITAITMRNTAVSGDPVYATFKEYHFRPGTGSMTSERQIDEAAGTQYVQTLLSLFFNRMETGKRLEMEAIALADSVAIVKDANGKWWYLGYDHPLHLNAGGAETGTARGDRNGYPVTLQDDSLELPHEVDAEIIDALID